MFPLAKPTPSLVFFVESSLFLNRNESNDILEEEGVESIIVQTNVARLDGYLLRCPFGDRAD